MNSEPPCDGAAPGWACMVGRVAGGDALCQCELGSLYAKGLGVPVDFRQAAVWYSQAAAQGFGAAFAGLGNIKLFGCVAPSGCPCPAPPRPRRGDGALHS